MTIKENEIVKPIKITDSETNRVYILDFDRDSVVYAEARGFDWDEVGSKPGIMIPLIWNAAFRRYDKKLSMEKTTKILETLGGMRPEWLARLKQLYDQSLASLIADPDETGEEGKNAKMTVSLD